MKIKSVRAFAIKNEMVGAAYREGQVSAGGARREPWNKYADVASPMDGYERFRGQRSKWRPGTPAVGCLVTADDGTTGFGVSRYGNPVISLINDHLASLLVDENPMATDRLWDVMMRITSTYSAMGIASHAISAVDLALWDLKGKLLRIPVYELAGGPARERQVCYATGNDTDWNMELGFKATKLACPHGHFDRAAGLAKNEELVARTRELIGPDIELMLDCWMSADVAYAVQLAERLRPYGLTWIEDCLTPENMDAHEELRRRLPWQTLATGEHWYTPHPFAQAAARRVADVFQPDICWAGGFTACQRINHIAETAGIPVILHAGMNTPYGQHFSLAAPNVPWGEYFVGSPPGVPLEHAKVFPGMAVPENGVVIPNGEPGFGLGLTEAVLESLLV
ncbi:enolase C-terminal domain-like protein [Chelativorans sp.]|uniref:enolase C-terminal domain-like protein n=1 Tax=Chelativorans sp. TaxID=2203393 RepID=UPI002810E2D8|nr:enolase C-terminal domain-like protein [Chelativorans sp.]